MKTLQISLSASAILYHITASGNAANILKTNEFQLKPNEGTESETELSQSAYYLSTTRSRIGAYVINSIHKRSVIFILDGHKLAQRYKIKPVDYWQSGFDKYATTETRTRNDETEDRVLSPKPKIPAATYIQEVHAMNDDLSSVIKKYCLYRKIPVYFYESSKDLMLLDKRKAVVVTLQRDKLNGPNDFKYPRKYQEIQYKERRLNSLRPWIELFYLPTHKKSSLSKPASSNLNRLRYHIGYGPKSEAVSSLNVDMHNAKSTPYGNINGQRESLDKVIAILRKNKWNTTKFIDYLYEKWIKPK